LKRFDDVQKHSLVVQRQHSFTEDQTIFYIHKLVELFMLTADSIKLSRTVEKVYVHIS